MKGTKCYVHTSGRSSMARTYFKDKLRLPWVAGFGHSETEAITELEKALKKSDPYVCEERSEPGEWYITQSFTNLSKARAYVEKRNKAHYARLRIIHPRAIIE
jgi:hypothetical protein